MAPRSLLIVTAVPLLAACAEEKVTHYRPMLAGLPGVESNTPITDARLNPKAEAGLTPPDQLVSKTPDGKKTILTAHSGRDLMTHIYNTLKDNDEALFLDQVLCTRTKDEYYERGLQPADAFRTLHDHFADVKTLFDKLPMGEYTPGVFLETVGPNVQRVQLRNRAAEGLAWNGFDMVFESGNQRLRWFTGPGPALAPREETDQDTPDKPPADDRQPAPSPPPVVPTPKRE